MKRRIRLLLAAAAVASLLLGAGCGGDDDDTGAIPTGTNVGTPTPPAPTIGNATATASPGPVTLANPTITASGLRYEDLVVGDGATPQPGQRLTVHYTGYFTDGRPFDSSLDRGQPYTFILGVGQVIAGWDQGIATMRVGGKRLLYVPSNLAYGSRGQGPVPPDTDLIFEVELLDVR